MRRVLPLAVVAVLSVVVATVLALVVTDRGPVAPGSGGTPAAAPGPAPAQASPSGPAVPRGVDLAQRFLETYVDPDGRVVRRDQGGDTVSEGQAYAMLLAVAADDERSFDRVWGWTQENLLRPDGLLSWTWRDGAVVDGNSASDADVDAAHALVVAAEAFGRDDLRTDGVALATAVLDHETAATPLGRVLVAGQWATTPPYRVNPSYSSPAAYRVLEEATGDPRWSELAAGDRAVLDRLLQDAPLPPDWAQVGADGQVAAMPGTDGAVDYGLDAQRVALRYGAACDPAARRVAATIGTRIDTTPAAVRGEYDLGGTPVVTWQHPLALVSAAAASAADGEDTRSSALVTAAAELDARASTYYGAAWAALGERLLEDPTSLGIACRAEEDA